LTEASDLDVVRSSAPITTGLPQMDLAPQRQVTADHNKENQLNTTAKTKPNCEATSSGLCVLLDGTLYRLASCVVFILSLIN